MSFSPMKNILHIHKSDLSYFKIVTVFTGITQKRLNKGLTTDLNCDFDTYVSINVNTKFIELTN